MVKIFNIFLIILSINYTYAQVGINSTTPIASLEAREKRESNLISSSISDGLLIPKLTLTELANKELSSYLNRTTPNNYINTNQEGTIVYIVDGDDLINNRPTTGASLNKTTEVVKEGFYFYGSDGNWKRLKTSNDSWINNRTISLIELNENSNGNTRISNKDLTINNNGFIGINNSEPSKRLDIDAGNDFIRVRNLKTSDNSTNLNALVIDNNGNIYKNSVKNYKDQVMRIPILESNTSTETGQIAIRLARDSLTSVSPSGNLNYINTIEDAVVKYDQNITSAGAGTVVRTTDRVKLGKGVYKITVRLTGFFASTLSQRAVFIKIAINNSEMSMQNFNTNTTVNGLTTFTYTDFLNIPNEASYLDMLIDTFGVNASQNFIISPYKDSANDNTKSIQSVLLIQRLR